MARRLITSQAGAHAGFEALTDVVSEMSVKKVFKYSYDFAVDGGTTSGPIVLRSDQGAMPIGFLLQSAVIKVLTPLDSTLHTATVSLGTGVDSAIDLVAASLVSAAPWSSTGFKATLALLNTIASWLTITGGATYPKITVAVQALTAGKFDLYCEGLAT